MSDHLDVVHEAWIPGKDVPTGLMIDVLSRVHVTSLKIPLMQMTFLAVLPGSNAECHLHASLVDAECEPSVDARAHGTPEQSAVARLFAIESLTDMLWTKPKLVPVAAPLLGVGDFGTALVMSSNLVAIGRCKAALRHVLRPLGLDCSGRALVGPASTLREATENIAVNGLHRDEAFARLLKELGAGQDAEEYLSRRRVAASTNWTFWLPSRKLNGLPPWLVSLAQAVASTIRAPGSKNARLPTAISSSIASTRRRGIASGEIVGFACGPNDTSATGEFVPVMPGADMVVAASEPVVRYGQTQPDKLRRILSGRVMRTYLASLMAYQDAGASPDGIFNCTPQVILDLLGAASRPDGLAYRYSSIDAIREDLATLNQVIVKQAGAYIVTGGVESLLMTLSHRVTGQEAYAHSKLVVRQFRDDATAEYIQIPRAVCRLSAGDVLSGIGLTQLVREQVSHCCENGLVVGGAAVIERPLVKLLESSGALHENGASKHGAQFYEIELDRFARVAEEGKIGRLAVAGHGAEAVVTLKVEPTLFGCYAGMVEAHRRYKRAKFKPGKGKA